MKITDLKQLLDENEINQKYFVIPPQTSNNQDTVVFIQPADAGKWTVYTEECGKTYDVTILDTEHEIGRAHV